MVVVRRAAVAGTFYPEDPPELHRIVSRFLRASARADSSPVAIIVPHAAYRYSGSVAGSAFARVFRSERRIERVVLLGPAHYEPVRGLAVSEARWFETPLGRVPLDTHSIEALRKLPQVVTSDRAHAPEHCIEVQLPFLQEALPDFRLVPLLVGEASPDEVAEVLRHAWAGQDDTLLAVSSDLSHYHDYASAQRLDRETAATIEALRYEELAPHQACGRNAIRGLLHLARGRGLRARTLELRNSGDADGPRDRVVGYGAFAFD